MTEKRPVILATLLESATKRWSVAALDREADIRPLAQSQAGNLDGYAVKSFDEQTGFLRHRIAGSLQRGADRLWPLNLKASLFVVWFDDTFGTAESPLIQRVADNFVQWIANPPVACFHGGLIAGEVNDSEREFITTAMQDVCRAADDQSRWEIIPSKPL